MEINKTRLWEQLHELGKIGRDEQGGITRWAFTDPELEAKDWLLKEMEKAGLFTYEDTVGNIIGIYNPLPSKEAPVLCGSHYDTVIHGGMFDGCLGLLGALEAARTLSENNVKIRRPLYVIGYKDEEGNRFSQGMIGSRVITGKAVEEDFLAMDAEGVSIGEAMKNSGYHPERYRESRIDPIHASVELHIEQGKVLEEKNCSVGIVEGIPYLRFYKVTFSGCSGHAGATPMDNRQDPVVAMAEWIGRITKLAASYPYTVATVGKIETFPGSVNVICDHATLTLDIRSMEEANMEACLEEMERFEEKLREAGVTVEKELRHILSGVECDGKAKDQLEHIMQERKLPYMRLMSGAGHDSQNFRGVCPCSMIFVRSKDGYSHRKEEFTSKEDCVNGANVLLDMIRLLCQEE